MAVHPSKILIVEDEETLRESLQRVLTREGYVVDAAGSAEDALKLELCAYDIIIADIILPGESGLDLLKKTRSLPCSPAAIIITAYATIETAVEAVKNGAYDYVVKPIIHEELKELLEKALSERISGT